MSLTGEGGLLGEDDGGGDAPAPALDGGACMPGDVRTFVPAAYRPATPAWQDVCTGDQLAAFYAACLATGPGTASPAACQAFEQASPANAACASCLLTPESATMYGPLINHGSFITENVGGCVELTDPGAGLGCAKAQQALAGCQLAACQASCPVSDPTTRDALVACESTAASAGCQMFATQAGCAAALGEAGVSTACQATTVHDFFLAVAPIFCGPPPSLEGGLRTDAAAGGDAAGEGPETGSEGGTEGGPADGEAEGAAPEGGHPDDAAPDAVTDASPD